MNSLKSLSTSSARALRRRPRSAFGAGAAFLIVVTVAAFLLAFKAPLLTFLRSGETITAEFDSSYRLRPDESKVKLSGLKVGVVRDVEYTDHGTARVSMKIDDSAMEALGSEPSAVIAPLTILGGVYSVELRPGGGTGRFDGDFIPHERTRVPVELDRILEALPQDTRTSLRNAVGQFGDTARGGGRDALRDVVAQAPDTLRPAGAVFEAAQGTRPGVDLKEIVRNFHTMSDVLSRDSGRLGGIVSSLEDTTGVLAEQAEPLAAGFESLPATLRASRTGLTDLDAALAKLTRTAESFEPSAESLEPLLRELNPVLTRTRPLLADLRPLMEDARPLVNQLVPVAQRGTEMLDHLRGPVLDRVNGPVVDTVMNTWRGSGPYEGNGGGVQADHKFYEELGYLVANMDRASMTQDRQGSMLGFQVSVGPKSVAGVPFTLPNLVEQMRKYAGGSR